MVDYESMIARYKKWTLSVLALYVLGAVFTPYNTVFNGLVLGGAISFYNLWLLQRRIRVVGEKVARGDTTRGGLGTASRMLFAGVGAFLAISYPETFHIIAVVVGIMSSYIVIVLDGIVRLIANRGRFE